jgi:hypothetical protein
METNVFNLLINTLYIYIYNKIFIKAVEPANYIYREFIYIYNKIFIKAVEPANYIY